MKDSRHEVQVTIKIIFMLAYHRYRSGIDPGSIRQGRAKDPQCKGHLQVRSHAGFMRGELKGEVRAELSIFRLANHCSATLRASAGLLKYSAGNLYV